MQYLSCVCIWLVKLIWEHRLRVGVFVCWFLCVHMYLHGRHYHAQSCVLFVCETWRVREVTRIVRSCFCFALVFTSCRLLCNFFFFFFCDLEQSAVQLFKELSNPALDLSRAAQPNRIVVLTLMTIPPAVAEPPVGHQEETIWQRGRWLTERDRCR